MKKSNAIIAAFMILVVFIFLYVAFVFVSEEDTGLGLSQNDDPADLKSSEINLVGPKWSWERIFISEDEIIFPRVHDAFSIEFKDEGNFYGTTDCNNFSSTFTKEENNLNFGIIASTKKYCNDSQEEVFLESISGVDEFYFNDKGRLVLKSGDSLIFFVDKESMQNTKNWALIKEAVLNCNIEEAGQTHDRKVRVTLKNGVEIEAYSPKIDNIFDIVESSRNRCGKVMLWTE